jgi:serine/threonine protein phosphatase PrpC
MGNSIKPCFSGHHHVSPATVSFEPNPDDSIGHSFSYHPTQTPTATTTTITAATNNPTAGFYSITGAAISANPSTPLSSNLLTDNGSLITASPAASFESSRSFTSNLLQSHLSASLSGRLSGPLSETGSVYSERSGFFSGPLDARLSCSSLNSTAGARFHRSIAQIIADRRARRHQHNSRPFTRLFSKLCRYKKSYATTTNGVVSHGQESGRGRKEFSAEDQSSVQWAQGRAGEDRVHVVVSEEHGWVFIGIYDGFNGPDATDFLLTHLYPLVHLELKRLFVNDDENNQISSEPNTNTNTNQEPDCCGTNECVNLNNINRVLRNQLTGSQSSCSKVQHKQILNALSEALKKTEKAYFEMTDQMAMHNPELAMMGSCVLVALMKGDHVYLMNVGDSRAVLAQKNEPDLCNILGRSPQDNAICGEDIRRAFDVTELSGLTAKQLTSDHSTNIDEVIKVASINASSSARLID